MICPADVVHKRCQVAGVEDRDQSGRDQRQRDEDVGRGASHRGQRVNLRRNCCRERTVSETVWKRSARLPPISRWIVTDMSTKRKSSELIRSAIAPSASSSGPAEPRLVDHPTELLTRRREPFVHDRLHAVIEALPDLQRARHRHEDVRQLVVECPQSSCAPLTRARRRARATPPTSAAAIRSGWLVEEADDHGCAATPAAAAQNDELRRAHLHVGALDQPLEGACRRSSCRTPARSPRRGDRRAGASRAPCSTRRALPLRQRPRPSVRLEPALEPGAARLRRAQRALRRASGSRRRAPTTSGPTRRVEQQ